MPKKYPSARTIQSWHLGIEEQGSKRIKARSLLKLFGAQRRGEAMRRRIDDYLANVTDHEGILRPLFVDWTTGLSLDKPVRLTREKTHRIGELWEGNEVELQKKYRDQIASLLDLTEIVAEYSPRGTRDRLDFLASDRKTGGHVVVELKVECGQKRAVEQIERYVDFIRKEKQSDEVRGVLITGIGDTNTRAALRTLDRPDLISWYLYCIVEGEFRLEKQ